MTSISLLYEPVSSWFKAYTYSIGISLPSASPDLTFLPVFLIVERTVSYGRVSAALISAVCFSRETSKDSTPVP
jgi:hypothetical protein